MIQVGDRVKWEQWTPVRRYLHTVEGRVKAIHTSYGVQIATIEANGKTHYEPFNVLERISPIEAIADDYHQLRHIGDLGGTELA